MEIFLKTKKETTKSVEQGRRMCERRKGEKVRTPWRNECKIFIDGGSAQGKEPQPLL